MASQQQQQQQQVYRFEVVNEECVFDLRPDQSVFDLMQIICKEWLNEARDSDGGVDDHMWLIDTSSGTAHAGPYEMGGFDRITETYRDSTKLQDLNLSPGSGSLEVEYDMGSTIKFTIAFKSIEQVPQDVTLPRVAPPDSGVVFTPYVPPSDSPNLDQVFPYANKLLFESIAQWIIPFPCANDSAGAVEAGPNAMADMVFMPHKLSNFKELLVAFNEAGKKEPDGHSRADAFCRLVFPCKLKPKDEKNYKLFKNELDEFEKYCSDNKIDGGSGPLDNLFGRGGLNMPDEHMHRLCGAKEVVVRVTEQTMEAVKDVDIARAFPLCEKAYQSNLWISYRRGKMVVCQGNDAGERGIPRPDTILAQANEVEITSLHEFFCIAEALLANVEAEKLWGRKDHLVHKVLGRKKQCPSANIGTK